MPRSKSGVKRIKLNKEDLEMAIKLIEEKTMTIGQAAKHFNLKKPTIIFHLHKLRASGAENYTYSPKTPKKIFNKEEELILVQYLKDAANMHYGLTCNQLRTLAYEYAVRNNKRIDPSWDKNRRAGEQWLRDFRKTYSQDLSLRKPEATSLARATAFNKETVAIVFNNYKKILQRLNLEPSDIWNCDETGITTVHKLPKILATKGKKQIGGMTSGERGTNVTMIAAVSASGNSIPPLFVFPRVNFKSFMLTGAPPGSVGAANPTGWSNEKIFIDFLHHFIKMVRPSIEKPVLLLLDNHESHVSLTAIELAKTSGVTLLTFHPHTSHKMQPLDRSVFGPFKTYYNEAVNNWMLSPGNSGKPVSIYDIAGLAGQAYLRAFTPSNITKGFQVSGFVPFDENIFSDSDFLAASVSDRPLPKDTTQSEDNNISVVSKCSDNILIVADQDKPSTSAIVSPENIRPHPKAGARKVSTSKKGKPKGKSRILTDTPEKNAIEQNFLMRCSKKNTNAVRKASVKRKVCDEEASSNTDEEPELSDESEDLGEDVLSEIRDLEEELLFEKKELEVGNFLLVKLCGKKSVKHFVAKIINIANDEFQVQYLKRIKGSIQKFIQADSNIYDLNKEDVICKLPKPSHAGGSARQQQYLKFGVDLSNIE